MKYDFDEFVREVSRVEYCGRPEALEIVRVCCFPPTKGDCTFVLMLTNAMS